QAAALHLLEVLRRSENHRRGVTPRFQGHRCTRARPASQLLLDPVPFEGVPRQYILDANEGVSEEKPAKDGAARIRLGERGLLNALRVMHIVLARALCV